MHLCMYVCVCVRVYVCVCVCVCRLFFDVVFTQLKAVLCVVSPQRYTPPTEHTHAHLRQCMLVYCA